MAKPILFCDFDGVLCHDRYWRSLSQDRYEKVQKLLFRSDKDLVNDWMRGKYSAEEINKIVSDQIEIPFETLWDIFVEDCKTMQVSQGLLQNLHVLRNYYTVILITGNMDSFSRFTHPALKLDNYFDEISNSYNEGVHKTDNEGALFLKYANKYGVPIEDCIAFDDSPNVHKVFLELGGTPYLITKDKDIGYHIEMISAQVASI